MWESGEISGYFWLGYLVEAAVISRPDYCCICFHTAHSLMWLFKGLRSSPSGALHRAAHNLAAGFPQIRERGEQEALVPGRDMLTLLSYFIGYTDQYWNMREDYTKLWMPVSRDHWRPSKRLAITKHILDLSYFSWNSSLVFQDNITYPLGFSASSFFQSHPFIN